ncbi:recombinase family protein [Sinosporangium album]|uniref:recombinase family protein n=1 Tax=Sinosporangium album TaxID=504805 RepID=UPI0015A00863|nr:recombinase family protein [Sinosporangium album]
MVGLIRLSNLTDTSSSPERQRLKVDQWADLKDAVVVGYAEDLDVSAIHTSPWDRPQLAEWLNRPQDYDVIVAWKLDRIARKAIDFLYILEWADRHNIRIVTIDDGIDLSTEIGRMVATILAVFAEFEGRTMRFRAKQAYDHNAKMGKWTGGTTPYGYMPFKTENGWKLIPDPVASAVLWEIIERVLKGESVRSITIDLNRRATLAPRNHFRASRGLPIKDSGWSTANVLEMLRSKILLGFRHIAGSSARVLKGDDGLPVARAEPLISLSKWKQIQAALDERKRAKKGPRSNGSKLLQVLYCPICRSVMYKLKSRGNHRYYRCSAINNDPPCILRGIPAAPVESHVEESLLAWAGDIKRLEPVHFEGVDYSEEIQQVEDSIKELEEDRYLYGLYSGPEGAARYREIYARLEQIHAELTARPTSPARTDWVDTGETYASYWNSLSEQQQAAELRAMGVKVYALVWHDLRDPDEWPDLPRATLGSKTWALGGEGRRKRNVAPIIHVDWGDLKAMALRAQGTPDDPEAIAWGRIRPKEIE